jgi:hypothetical protein
MKNEIFFPKKRLIIKNKDPNIKPYNAASFITHPKNIENTKPKIIPKIKQNIAESNFIVIDNNDCFNFFFKLLFPFKFLLKHYI